jgi:hypothetical protein
MKPRSPYQEKHMEPIFQPMERKKKMPPLTNHRAMASCAAPYGRTLHATFKAIAEGQV